MKYFEKNKLCPICKHLDSMYSEGLMHFGCLADKKVDINPYEELNKCGDFETLPSEVKACE